MGILARGCPLVDPLYQGCIDGSSHDDPAEQLIAHLLGAVFYGQGQVLDFHLNFPGELLSGSLEPKVVFAQYILEFYSGMLEKLPLEVEG